MRWGSSTTTDPWPTYDQLPSGRLAIVIHANSYLGLRRRYSDGKTQALERMLPDILAGFVGHAAFISERRRENENESAAIETPTLDADVRKLSTVAKSAAWSLWIRSMTN